MELYGRVHVQPPSLHPKTARMARAGKGPVDVASAGRTRAWRMHWSAIDPCLGYARRAIDGLEMCRFYSGFHTCASGSEESGFRKSGGGRGLIGVLEGNWGFAGIMAERRRALAHGEEPLQTTQAVGWHGIWGRDAISVNGGRRRSSVGGSWGSPFPVFARQRGPISTAAPTSRAVEKATGQSRATMLVTESCELNEGYRIVL